MGGFTTGRKEIIDMLRQRSRPYLFSNSVAPAIVGASIEMFRTLQASDALHDKLIENVTYFRDKMLAAGFDIKPTQSAICAVMLYRKTLLPRCKKRVSTLQVSTIPLFPKIKPASVCNSRPVTTASTSIVLLLHLSRLARNWAC